MDEHPTANRSKYPHYVVQLKQTRKMWNIYILLLLSLCAIKTEQGIFDRLPKLLGNKRNPGCPLCQEVIRERCDQSPNPKTGENLCKKIAQDVCPVKLLNLKTPTKLPNLSQENSDELFAILKEKRPEKKEEDLYVLDLMTGIFKALHSSSKADVKRAKEKELRQKLLKIQ